MVKNEVTQLGQVTRGVLFSGVKGRRPGRNWPLGAGSLCVTARMLRLSEHLYSARAPVWESGAPGALVRLLCVAARMLRLSKPD